MLEIHFRQFRFEFITTFRSEGPARVVNPIYHKDKVSSKTGDVAFYKSIIASYDMGLIDITVIDLGYN